MFGYISCLFSICFLLLICANLHSVPFQVDKFERNNNGEKKTVIVYHVLHQDESQSTSENLSARMFCELCCRLNRLNKEGAAVRLWVEGFDLIF